MRAFLRRYRRALISGTILLLIVVGCVCAALLAPYDPITQNAAQALQSPNGRHWFGTDEFGRDLLSRILFGGRPTILIGVSTVALAAVIGIPIGLLAGYFGSRADAVLMRTSEIGLVLPPLVLAVAVVGALGVSARNVVIALGIVFAPMLARVARAATLVQRRSPYIDAAIVGGEGNLRVITSQLLPNALAPIMVQALLTFGYAVLAEASLSFLGLGTQPPLPSWGRMLSDGTDLIQTAPWLVIFPGLAIMVTVLALNIFGDGLRDAWDPMYLASVASHRRAAAPSAEVSRAA
jgi:peptide/nickel transport system permease protein